MKRLNDFNETIGEDIDGIESIANEIELVHLMKQRDSTLSLPTHMQEDKDVLIMRWVTRVYTRRYI